MKNMKIITLTSITLLTVTIAISCKSKKAVSVQKETGAIEISVPFSGREYRSDENNFRAKQVVKSPDLST